MGSLTAEVDALLARQREAWPLLGRGLASLDGARTRTLLADGHEVTLRHLPHRVASTTAAVDRASIARRPCFLCPANLDPAEEGLPFGPDLTIYPNPFPITSRHLTIVHREHRPQRIEGLVGPMLDLAAALPPLFVFYNGPECGASAPDHLHVQAASRNGLPAVRAAEAAEGPALSLAGARALLFRGTDRARLVADADRALAALSEVTGKAPEPWVNVAVWSEPGAGWTVLLLPRGKHRPAAFHTGELTISPAAIDLCGLLVAPLPGDFERLTGERVAALFREVTLPESPFQELVARLEGR